MKKAIVAAISMAALLSTTSGASAQACVVGVIAAAMHANWRDNRELTAQEAATCGTAYLFAAPQPQKKKVRRAKRKKTSPQ
jgi:hypothetical protein